MFRTWKTKDKRRDSYHLAHKVSLLRSTHEVSVSFIAQFTSSQWAHLVHSDATGNRFGATGLPDDSLEQSEENLGGENKARSFGVRAEDGDMET